MGRHCVKVVIIHVGNAQDKAVPIVQAAIKICSEKVTIPEAVFALLNISIQDQINYAVLVIINVQHAKLPLQTV